MCLRARQTPSLAKLCRDLHRRLCPLLAGSEALPRRPVSSIKGEYGDTELTLACTMEGESIRANGTADIHPSPAEPKQTAQAEGGSKDWQDSAEVTWKSVSPAVSTPEALRKSWWSRVFHQDIHREVPIANTSSPASRGWGPTSSGDTDVTRELSQQPAPNSCPTHPGPSLPGDNHVHEATWVTMGILILIEPQ